MISRALGIPDPSAQPGPCKEQDLLYGEKSQRQPEVKLSVANLHLPPWMVQVFFFLDDLTPGKQNDAAQSSNGGNEAPNEGALQPKPNRGCLGGRPLATAFGPPVDAARATIDKSRQRGCAAGQCAAM
mmetsp:Transcript_40004/g.89829  ORF Transcript_40004/g.89829 Transcript_40004/m.89829 type:complete len:128 (-) Transcript_40004:61-444(-)